MAGKGIQIGRGYIAVDLDEKGAREALAAFRKDAEKALSTISQQRKVDADTTTARKEIDKFAKDAEKTMGAAAKWIGMAGSALSALGIGALGAHAAAGGLLQLAGSASSALVTMSGAAAVLPAVFGAIVAVVAAATIGMNGFFDALGDGKKAAKAYEGLAQNAKATVDAVKQLESFGTGIQQNLFEGMADTVKTLGATYIPVLRDGLAGVATELNVGAQRFAGWLSSSKTLADTGTLFDNIRESLKRLAPAGTDFAKAMTDMAVVGSSLLPGLADSLATVVHDFARLVNNARGDGSLKEVMVDGMAAVRDLGTVVKNVFTGIMGIFKAGQGSGQGFFATLKEITGAFTEWTNSFRGQAALRDFFAGARDAAQSLIPAVRSAAEVIGSTIVPQLARIGQIAAPALEALVAGIGTMVARARPGLEAFIQGFTDMVSAVSRGGDAIGRLISAVGSTLGPVLSVLGAIITNVVIPAINMVASVIEHNTGLFGGLILALVAGVVAWKAFGAAATLVDGAMKVLNPAKVAGELAKAMDNVALKGGVMVESMTGSAAAGTRFAEAGSKVGKVLSSIGGALPLIGIGVLAVGAAFELSAMHAQHLADEAKNVGQGLALGGKAAQEAASKMVEYQQKVTEAQKKLNEVLSQGGGGAVGGGRGGAALSGGGYSTQYRQQIKDETKALEDAQKANQDYIDSLSPLDLAQAKAAARQKEYNQAVRDSGPESAQAASALSALKDSTADVEREQRKAADAARTHDQALAALADRALAAMNADANLKLSLLDLSTAQQAAIDTANSSTASTEDKTRANANYEITLSRVIQATRDKAMADNAGLLPAEQLAAANNAVANQVMGLVVAAGSNAPPALQALAGKMYDSQQAAIEATIATGRFQTKVLELPDGRRVVIAVDDNGSPVIDNIAAKLAALPRNIRIGIEAVESGRDLTGAFSNGVPRASGGPMTPGVLYKTSEMGPELIIPDRTSYVASTSQTRGMLNGVSQANPENQRPIQQNIYPSQGMSEQNVADLAAAGIAWRSRF